MAKILNATQRRNISRFNGGSKDEDDNLFANNGKVDCSDLPKRDFIPLRCVGAFRHLRTTGKRFITCSDTVELEDRDDSTKS